MHDHRSGFQSILFSCTLLCGSGVLCGAGVGFGGPVLSDAVANRVGLERGAGFVLDLGPGGLRAPLSQRVAGVEWLGAGLPGGRVVMPGVCGLSLRRNLR